MIDAMHGTPGRRIIQASWAGTIVFTVTAVVAVAMVGTMRYVAVAVALVLFALGCAAFFWGYGIAVQRSRTAEIGIGGLFFLAGKETAPPRVKGLLLGSLGVQVLVAFVTAGARPYTTLAFGMLAPVFGLGCIGLWSARYGHFGPRVAPAPTRRGRRTTTPGLPSEPGTRPQPDVSTAYQDAAAPLDPPPDTPPDAPPDAPWGQDVPEAQEIGQNARHG